MNRTADELLRRTRLLVRKGPYAMGAWPPAQVSAVYAGILRGNETTAFVMLDEREATALLHEKNLPELPPPKSIERGWSVITLDQKMDWDVVGVLAIVSQALAAASIPIGAATAFSRDHILVPRARLEDALLALKERCGEIVVGE